MEGFIFGGAYLRREICVSKSIGISLITESKFIVFASFYFVFESNFPSTSPRGGGGGGDLYLTEGFFALSVWAAYIWRGLFSEFCGIFFKPFSSLFKIYLLRLQLRLITLTKKKKKKKNRGLFRFLNNPFDGIHNLRNLWITFQL